MAISYPVPYGTLAEALRPFGATPSVINGLPTSPRYALVGTLDAAAAADGLSPDSPEAGAQIAPGATGRLQGVLQPGHDDMLFTSVTSNAPVIRSFNGQQQPPTVTNYGLYEVIAHVDAAWPVPAAGPSYDARAKALTYLSQQACSCTDIRDQYNASDHTIQTWQQIIRSRPYPPGQDFTESSFTTVRDQLLTELGDVFVVDGLKQGTERLLSDH